MFLASPWLEIDVQTGHFAEFEQFIIDSHFFWLWESHDWPYSFIFTDFGQVTIILLSLGGTLDHEKYSKLSRFDKKFRNYAYDLAQDIFSDSLSRNQKLAGSLINK